MYQGIIYVAKNEINDKVYIGKTRQELNKRKENHKFGMNNIKLNKIVFYKALKKYGWDNFEWSIIDTAENEIELNEKEKYWISEYRKNNICYNMTDGGDGLSGLVLSDEHKKKIGDAQRGEKNHMYGKHLSEETKRKLSEKTKGISKPNKLKGRKHSPESLIKMSESKKGIKKSEEYCKALSERMKGNIPWNKGLTGVCVSPNKGKNMSEEQKLKLSIAHLGKPSPMKGKKHSEETKRKISESEKGKKLSEEHKEILRIKNTGSNNAMYGKKRPDLSERNKLRAKNKEVNS